MNKPSLQDKDFLTVEDTAEFFELSKTKLYKFVKQENLPFIAKYKNRKLIIKDEFVKYLEKNNLKEDLARGKLWTKKR